MFGMTFFLFNGSCPKKEGLCAVDAVEGAAFEERGCKESVLRSPRFLLFQVVS